MVGLLQFVCFQCLLSAARQVLKRKKTPLEVVSLSCALMINRMRMSWKEGKMPRVTFVTFGETWYGGMVYIQPCLLFWSQKRTSVALQSHYVLEDLFQISVDQVRKPHAKTVTISTLALRHLIGWRSLCFPFSQTALALISVWCATCSFFLFVTAMVTHGSTINAKDHKK